MTGGLYHPEDPGSREEIGAHMTLNAAGLLDTRAQVRGGEGHDNECILLLNATLLIDEFAGTRFGIHNHSVLSAYTQQDNGIISISVFVEHMRTSSEGLANERIWETLTRNYIDLIPLERIRQQVFIDHRELLIQGTVSQDANTNLSRTDRLIGTCVPEVQAIIRIDYLTYDMGSPALTLTQ
jgi:hypothetical protein